MSPHTSRCRVRYGREGRVSQQSVRAAHHTNNDRPTGAKEG